MDIGTGIIIYVLYFVPLAGNVMLEVGEYDTKKECQQHGVAYAKVVAQDTGIQPKRLTYGCWAVHKLSGE